MAEIRLLEGYMTLRYAWRIILANDVNMNAELEAIKDRIQEYIFYVNPTQLSINTTQTTLIKFNPEVISHTHVVVGFALNIDVGSATNINITIKYDGLTLITMIQGLNLGWNVIAFPYIIPSVGTGTHSIEVVASLDTGTAVIEANKLNVFLQAQSILGSSSLPPALNILGEIPYSGLSTNKIIEIVTPTLIDNVTIQTTELINYADINNNKITSTVTIQLE